MRLLVTGASGLLGPYLMDAASNCGEALGVARRGTDYACDLGDALAVRALLARTRPDVVLHAAAMTDVDGCEADPAAAERANAAVTRYLVEAAPVSCRLVYISTDQVYPDTSGLKREHIVGPINVYGRSKLAGEAAACSRADSLILRCNMFGPSRSAGRQSFSDWIIGSLQRGDPVTFFTDVLFSPLHFATLSALVIEAVSLGLAGTFNLGSRNGFSKRDFALMISQHLDLPLAYAREGLSSQVVSRAARPLDLRMDVGRIETALGRPMPTLEEEVRRL